MPLKTNKTLPTPEQLYELLDYNPETGELHWKRRPIKYSPSVKEHRRWNGRYAGKLAFRMNPTGYLEGFVLKKMVKAHRVAWAIYYGEWPDGYIDHINGVRADNRIDNLRIVTASENARNQKLSANSTTGILGVCAHGDRWRAHVFHDGKQHHLGTFDTVEEAAAARQAASVLCGYHANHGANN